MGAALSNLDEPAALGFRPPREGCVAHLCDLDGLRADELPSSFGSPTSSSIATTSSELIDSLRVRAWPPWDVSQEQTPLSIALDDPSEGPHAVQASARSDGQQAAAADERRPCMHDRRPCRDAPGLRPSLLAAVVRSLDRSGVAAERPNVRRTCQRLTEYGP